MTEHQEAVRQATTYRPVVSFNPPIRVLYQNQLPVIFLYGTCGDDALVAADQPVRAFRWLPLGDLRPFFDQG